jgi:hypothetical protein
VNVRKRRPARFALLIGNQLYNPKVATLKNPHNDVARRCAKMPQRQRSTACMSGSLACSNDSRPY